MKKKRFQEVLLIVLVITSVICSICILMDTTKPEYYYLLFLVPLTFGMSQLCSYKLYNIIPDNIAVLIIIVLFFCKMVISPFLMYIGNYESTITINLQYNTDKACLLVCYEALAIFIGLDMFRKKQYGQNVKEVEYINKKGKKLYILIVIVVIIVLSICYKITPQLSLMYRTIFNMNDQFFTNQEDSYIIDQYGNTFIKKLSLVVGMYLMRAAILVVPAVTIILLSQIKKRYMIIKIISYFLCIIPLFFIGGAIARSLIYIVCLILLRNYLFDIKNSNKKIFIIGGLCIIAILYWWVFNAQNHPYDSMAGYLSGRFSSYFSGVNIVSGVFNLPNEVKYKMMYFLYDFTTTLPFGNTIFATKNITIQPFFNLYNNSYGQIPPTIGMGYYYFGPILAPIYSVIFSYIAFRNGEKIRLKNIRNPFQYIRLLYAVFVFSMGMTMYNIEITMTNTFCLIIPMRIMERLAYGKENKHDT